MWRPLGRNNQRLLFAQAGRKKPKGCDLCGGIHPDFVFPQRVFTQRDQADDVIKLRRRWHVHIEFAVRIDQRRRGVKTRSLKQRGQQSMFVFAVAVLVVKHITGGMRLVTSSAE